MQDLTTFGFFNYFNFFNYSNKTPCLFLASLASYLVYFTTLTVFSTTSLRDITFFSERLFRTSLVLQIYPCFFSFLISYCYTFIRSQYLLCSTFSLGQQHFLLHLIFFLPGCCKSLHFSFLSTTWIDWIF